MQSVCGPQTLRGRTCFKGSLQHKKTGIYGLCHRLAEKVYPMVPAGAAIDEMLFLEEKKKTEKKLKAVK